MAPMTVGSRLSSLVVFALTATTAFANPLPRNDEWTVESILARAAQETSLQYNSCAISIAFNNGTYTAEGVAGTTQLNGTIAVTPDDRFVWGSITKMLTGTAILRLVAEGLLSIDSPIGPILDRAFQTIRANSPSDAKLMNYSSVTELFGAAANNLTVRNLGKMLSGIPDFDTAHGHGVMVDSLRADMYAHPTHFYGPMEILAFPWVYNGTLQPVGHHSYSSTNFLLLGLMLSELHNATS